MCENLHAAGKILRSHVRRNLPRTLREPVLENTGFAQAVVSRMVPLQTVAEDGPLLVRVEAYKRLPIDRSAIVGALPDIAGVEPVDNFAAHEARKLYTHNCAHATLGYLGWHAGHEYGYQALRDSRLRRTLDAVLTETGTALIARFGVERVIAAGSVLLLLSAGISIAGITLWHFWIGLILLGVGWNFGFIGATALVTQTHRAQERTRVQSFNDFLVFGSMAIGSFASGKVLAAFGWAAVNEIVFPVVLVAAVMLVWLVLRERRARA